MVPVLFRYLLIQLAGWVMLGIALGLLHLWFDLPLWLSWTAVGALVVKDLVIYPWVRDAYDDKPGRWVGVERVVGQRGLVIQTLDPRGMVRVAGERWAAQSATGATLREGVAVVVLDVNGLTLTVSEEGGPDTLTA